MQLNRGQFSERQQMRNQAETEANDAKEKYARLLETSGWPAETEHLALETRREQLTETEKIFIPFAGRIKEFTSG